VPVDLPTYLDHQPMTVSRDSGVLGRSSGEHDDSRDRLKCTACSETFIDPSIYGLHLITHNASSSSAPNVNVCTCLSFKYNACTRIIFSNIMRVVYVIFNTVPIVVVLVKF